MRKAKRVFGFTDIHWSDHDQTALAVAEKAQRHFKPHTTVIGGDLLNCGPFSRHPKIKLDEDAEYDLETSEIKPANRFLDRVQKHTRSTTYLIEGNHDAWIERWLASLHLGRKTLQCLLPSKALSANRRNFRYVPNTEINGQRSGYVKLHRDLIAVHGWCANKYAAQTHIDRARDKSVIFHHTHRIDYRVLPLFDGRPVIGMSAGCLCKRQPIYAHGGCPSDWIHGFWVAYVGRHSFTCYPVPILRGKAVLPDGTEIVA
jgi:3',5'-cyclic AMP phosphodiesterase CpdA